MAHPTLPEATITRVLLALWAQRQTTSRQLAIAAAVPDSQIPQALAVLRDRQCLIEQTPDGLTLVQTGLPCWRDVLQARAVATSPGIAIPGSTPSLPRGTSGHALGTRSLVFQKTTSTNDVCWQYAADPAAHGLVVLADEQSAGRGRRGNAWLAKAGQSILMSILLRDLPSANLDTLTLQLGLATAQAIEECAGIETTIKWPNDVLHQDRKLAGVLVETRQGSALTSTGGNSQHVVLGIGLNVAQAMVDLPDAVASSATSLYQVTGQVPDRLTIAIALLNHIESLCLSPRPQEQWLPAWKSRCSGLGQSIMARSSDSIITGQLLDIDPLHGLVLLDESGSRHFLSAQTTTLNAER